MPKLNITQASITSIIVFILGQVVAFVPSLSTDKQVLISAGTAVVAAVFAIVHALPFHQAAAKSVNADVPYKLVPVASPQQGQPRGQ